MLVSSTILSDLSIPDLKQEKKKEWTETVKKWYKYYVNAQRQIPVLYGSKLHITPTNYHLVAAKQEPYRKVYLLTKIY